MDIFIGVIKVILEEGLIYAILALGVYISYSVLDFPDLSVDGSFPLGACVTALLINAGCNPIVACLAAFICGGFAGLLTGALNVFFGIRDILCGIITMTALWTVNLLVLGNSSVVPFYNKPTIFNSGLASLLKGDVYKYRIVIIALILALAVKYLLDLFLSTKAGLLLRAAGDNVQVVTSLARNPGRVRIYGLGIGNAFAALAGSVLAQQAESANIYSGTGMVVLALASVIIGASLFGKIRFMRPTSAVVLGAVAYKACLAVAMQLGLPTAYLKLLMAVILIVALSAGKIKGAKKRA